jgi:hypothetical protein
MGRVFLEESIVQMNALKGLGHNPEWERKFRGTGSLKPLLQVIGSLYKRAEKSS